MSLVPDFFVLGAQKAGTTALHDWLVQQPDICLPTIKETHYFSHDDRYRLGLDWYQRQFPANCPPDTVRGEVDPEYMFYGRAAERIRVLNPNPKFIFLLRQPLERAYSQYLMSVRRGYEDLSFAQALSAESARLADDTDGHAMDHQSYLARGLYSRQIRHYREMFPASQFLFIKFDDLINKEGGLDIYTSICRFLGINSSPALAVRDKKSNQASTPRSIWLRDQLYQRGKLRKFIGGLIPSKDIKMRLGIWLDKINQQPAENLGRVTDYTLSADILKIIREEIAVIEIVTGLTCSDWIERLDKVGVADELIA